MSVLIKMASARTRVMRLGLALGVVTVQLSKNGGAFAAPSAGVCTQLGVTTFWTVTLDATDTNTLGDLAYQFASTGLGVLSQVDADQVTALLPGEVADVNVTKFAGGVVNTATSGLIDVNVIKWASLFVPGSFLGDYGPIDCNVSLWLDQFVRAPDLAGNINCNVDRWNNIAVPAPNASGHILVDTQDYLGNPAPALNGFGNYQVDVIQYLGSAAPALTGPGYYPVDVYAWNNGPLPSFPPATWPHD